jgi:hypothetical protein
VRLLLVLTCVRVFVDTVFYATLVLYLAQELGLSKPAVGSGEFLGAARGRLVLMSATSPSFGAADMVWQFVTLLPLRRLA